MTASALKGTWTNTGRAGGQPTSTLLSRSSSQKEELGENTVGVGKENSKEPHINPLSFLVLI
jgi:hypothetical protein